MKSSLTTPGLSELGIPINFHQLSPFSSNYILPMTSLVLVGCTYIFFHVPIFSLTTVKASWYFSKCIIHSWHLMYVGLMMRIVVIPMKIFCLLHTDIKSTFIILFNSQNKVIATNPILQMRKLKLKK